MREYIIYFNGILIKKIKGLLTYDKQHGVFLIYSDDTRTDILMTIPNTYLITEINGSTNR